MLEGVKQRPKGQRTRTAILEEAARLATVDGLEGLSIGISGKLALWENLQAAADEEPRLRAFDFDELTGRARSQLERLHGERLAAARLALR